MKVLSWNSRGLGHPSKIATLRDLLHNEKPEIMLVQETKQDQQEMKKIIDHQKQYLGIISSSRGASGGIVTIWDSHRWICDSAIINKNWIRTKLDSRTGDRSVIIYNVYVPNHYREKETCWDNLKGSIESESTTNLIIAGDFNMILHANEKRGGNFTHDPFRNQLEAIIQENELVDIIPKNRRYTWSNQRMGAGNIMECLDRFLVNISFLSTFVVGYTSILSTSASDHYPVSLMLESHRPLGPIPFKFRPLWTRNSIARVIVEMAWRQHVEGSPSYIWETKIKNVKRALKDWARDNYQEPEETKKKVKKALEEGGDKNTAYFHKQAIARKIRNNVNSIIDNEGNRYNNQEDIKKAASTHYRDLLTETQGVEDYSDLLQYLPKGVTKELNDMLNREIDEEEIKRTIWTLQPDKAPGPDEFPICFYREFWSLIKKDLTKMLRWVQKKGKMGGFTNSTFLALIPKENRPTSFSRFRPISLSNSSYKFFTKILAMRLKPSLPSLISENQGGFISNRHIHDSIILVQEAIHSSLSRQEKGFVLKLDLANAFDRVRHSFLFVVLKRWALTLPSSIPLLPIFLDLGSPP
eukprot:PITA_10075